LIATQELEALTYDEKLRVVEWMREHSGAEGFVPNAIRRMPLRTRVDLAFSPELTAAWEARERNRVAASPFYFIRQYGSIEPPKGKPTPFELWVAQNAPRSSFCTSESRVYVLKARRLGLSWLVLHYALWLLGYSTHGEFSRILFLSKNLEDAGKMLDRVKRINDRLPSFLRASADGRGFGARLSFAIGAITSSRDAGRSPSGNCAACRTRRVRLCEERKASGEIWTAVQATIEGGGQVVRRVDRQRTRGRRRNVRGYMAQGARGRVGRNGDLPTLERPSRSN
jgi:hypothetical protein